MSPLVRYVVLLVQLLYGYHWCKYRVKEHGVAGPKSEVGAPSSAAADNRAISLGTQPASPSAAGAVTRAAAAAAAAAPAGRDHGRVLLPLPPRVGGDMVLEEARVPSLGVRETMLLGTGRRRKK